MFSIRQTSHIGQSPKLKVRTASACAGFNLCGLVQSQVICGRKDITRDHLRDRNAA